MQEANCNVDRQIADQVHESLELLFFIMQLIFFHTSVT